MPVGSFETFFAEFGRKVDEAVAGYKEAATHRVVLKHGDDIVASAQVPLESVKEFFGKASETINEAAGTLKSKMSGAMESVGKLRIEVEPLPKASATQTPEKDPGSDPETL